MLLKKLQSTLTIVSVARDSKFVPLLDKKICALVLVAMAYKREFQLAVTICALLKNNNRLYVEWLISVTSIELILKDDFILTVN